MQIIFLDRQMLWALPLALAPLAIHFLFKRKPAALPFGDLHFIILAAERTRKSTNLRKYLLLLARTLIIAALILGLARPKLFKGQKAEAAGRGGTAAAVLLCDASYSMGYYGGAKRRFDAFKEKARRMLELLPEGTLVGAAAYSDRLEASTPGVSADRQSAARLAEELVLSNRPTEISAALDAAAEMLEHSGAAGKTVIVLSDMARHGFNARPKKALQNVRIICFKPQSGENTLIERSRLEYDEGLERFQVYTEARSEGRDPPESLPVSYYLNGTKTASHFLPKNGRSNYEGTHVFSGFEGERAAGMAVLPADRLEADDSFYFTAERPASRRVWIFDGDPKIGGVTAESYFLRNALPEAELMSESGLDKAVFSVPGTVVLANTGSDHASIEQFARSGGGVIIFPGDRVPEGFTAPYLPADIGTKRALGRESVEWQESGHQAMEELEAGSFDWEKISVERSFVLVPKHGSTVLARLGSGRPFLVEGSYGKGKVILFAAPADRDWSNLSARPLFAPLLSAFIRYAAGADPEDGAASCLIGGTYRGKAPSGTVVVTPDGKREKPVFYGDNIFYTGTAEPGIYRIESDGAEINRFAVNLDRASEEGVLAELQGNELRKYFTDSSVIELPHEDWERPFVAALSGHEISREAYAAALLLLVIESLLAYRSKKARRKYESAYTAKN